MRYVARFILALSDNNIRKQFVPRFRPDKVCRARSGSKLFYTLMVFLKEFFDKIDFEKKSADGKNYPVGKEFKRRRFYMFSE